MVDFRALVATILGALASAPRYANASQRSKFRCLVTAAVVDFGGGGFWGQRLWIFGDHSVTLAVQGAGFPLHFEGPAAVDFGARVGGFLATSPRHWHTGERDFGSGRDTPGSMPGNRDLGIPTF